MVNYGLFDAFTLKGKCRRDCWLSRKKTKIQSSSGKTCSYHQQPGSELYCTQPVGDGTLCGLFGDGVPPAQSQCGNTSLPVWVQKGFGKCLKSH
ncbi:hypothetical protein CHARACLAT_016434 [Characodon lateralis]|uniref:Uncharacterized protein n=1 Tax=Characodon lateralis TaxID=208331 RepID=A0ABU7E2K1_9TELE|nr:hypothetical protein [Characodon lateralis]